MSKKLVILDPNLRNLLDHYFEYDRSIAEAASRNGIETAIRCHRDVVLPTDLPFAVHPVYSSDIWKTLPGESYHSEWNIQSASAAFVSETRNFLGRWPL